MKRVRHVWPDDMVAHLWAHQTQEDARNARGNFYFLGDTIYSYGRHFPVARIVTNKRKSAWHGECAVLVTTREYSHTTAGHKSTVRSACRHLERFNVSDVTGGGLEWVALMMRDYEGRKLELMRKYAKARTRKPEFLGRMREVVQEAAAFARFFGSRRKVSMPAEEADMEAECKRQVANEERRKRRAVEKRLKEVQEAMDKWMSGQCVPYNFYGLPVRLRIMEDELQTSLGASVPIKDAKRVYKILKRLRKRQEHYQRNGESITLGQFTLDSMDGDGTVKVGCHTVEWSEIERVAKLAGL